MRSYHNILGITYLDRIMNDQLKVESTLGAAVHEFNYTCLETFLFFWCESAPSQLRLSSSLRLRNYPLRVAAWPCASSSVGLGKIGCNNVTTHNSTERCS
ncbi:hypothetical protein PoB_005265300 [Plakobranchus ocellatus]|uniref:Uncharacterized protein n=1 Tax=Plakobranchus ocellatus TaxID=259542 RepID=A0AAV4C415_9GAST|nr:hypothetical protein PoB_005265300 [Plakobranchus ocellatus]